MVVVVALVAVACTGTKPKAAGTATGKGSVSMGSLSVQIPGTAMPITLTRGTPPVAAAAEIATTKRAGATWSTPVQVSAPRPLPSGGAVLTRRYDSPLPDGAQTAFAYFDTDLGGWRSVPSTPSPDRKTLTATVHHFSWWDDFWTGVGDGINQVSGDVTYGLGQFFDVRVDAPPCDQPKPSWIDSTVMLDDKNAPLRWCVGHDPKHADWVVIKTRVNRGYGLALQTDTARSGNGASS
jgi:hypothetical protein